MTSYTAATIASIELTSAARAFGRSVAGSTKGGGAGACMAGDDCAPEGVCAAAAANAGVGDSRMNMPA